MKQQILPKWFMSILLLLAVWLTGCSVDAAVQHTLQGNVLRQKAEWEQAIVEYDAAIAFDPELAEAYYNRALVYDVLDDNARALADIDRAIELKPGVAEFYRLRGRVYRMMENYAASLTNFDKALELDPHFQSAYVGRGITYGQSGEFERALQDFNQALQLDPTDVDAYYYRGLTSFYLGDYEPASADFTQAIQLEPEYTYAYCLRGVVYSSLGDYDLAIGDYNQALQLEPELAYGYYSRGLTYAELGDAEQAIADLERYLALTPGAPDHSEVEAWIEELQQQIAQRSDQPSLDLTQLQERPLLHLALPEPDGTSQFVVAATLLDGQRLGTAEALAATWSPQGDQFAFFAPAGEKESLFVMDLTGKSRRIFTPSLTEELIGWLPAWSPDGQQVAIIVAHYTQDAPMPTYVVVVSDATAPGHATRHPIPEGTILLPFHMSPPNKFRWSPDGQKILVAWEQAVVLNLAQDRIVPIADQPVVAEWAADSAGVYYFPITNWDRPEGRELGGFYLRPLDAEAAVELVDAQGLVAFGIRMHPGLHNGLSVLSPSSTQLAWVGGGEMVNDEDLSVRIAIFAVMPGDILALDKPVHSLEIDKQIVAFEWSPDEQRAAMLTLDQAGTIAVEVLNLDTEEWTTLYTLDAAQWTAIVGDMIDGLEWLGLGKHLSWTQ